MSITDIMRKKSEYTAHFTFSYKELISKSIAKEAYLRRDLVALTPRGITTAKINDMVALRVALQGMPTEETNNEIVTLVFLERDETAALLTEAVRNVTLIAKATFGDKSNEYKAFWIKALSKLSPSELSNKAPNIVEKGNKYFDEMDDNGLTAEMLTNITTLTTNLVGLTSNTAVAEGDSKLVTGDRRSTADELYDSMSWMCQTANGFFKGINKLKAANYTLYGNAGKTIVRKGKVKAGKTSSPKTKGIKTTTKFNLKTSSGDELQYYFALTKRSPSPESAITVKCNKKLFTTTTAAKLGYNKAGGMTILNILNMNDHKDATYLVRIG